MASAANDSWMIWEATRRAKMLKAERQSFEEMSVCRGMKSTTMSLIVLLTDEFTEMMKSAQSCFLLSEGSF